MPTVCIVPGCKSVHRKGADISFHELPKDEERRAKWLAICGINDWYRHGRICSRHFEASAYERNLKYELLGLPMPPWLLRFKPGALPTLHLQNSMGK